MVMVKNFASGKEPMLTYLNCDFHYLGVLTLLCPFIENCKASLNGIFNISKSFFYRLTLGVAAGKSRAADNETAIFDIFFDDDFQIQMTSLIISYLLNYLSVSFQSYFLVNLSMKEYQFPKCCLISNSKGILSPEVCKPNPELYMKS